MFKLAEAYVELSQKGFGTISGKLDQIRGKMGSVTRAGGLMAAGIGAVGGSLVALASFPVRAAAKLEQLETQFKTLLGSTDAAKKKIEELQSFAATTPFQLDGLADSAKTLLAFGTANDQVIPTMQVLGDVAAATGNQVNELAGIYGKVRARGALMTEQLDQFNERGIPVGAKLSEMLGKTGDEIRSMASKGELGFSDLQKALQSMNSEGGMAFNGMAEQSTTLSGLWSTLKDNAALVFGDIGKAIVEGFDLKGSTADMTAFIQRLRAEWLPSIVDGFRWVKEHVVGPLRVMMAFGREQFANFVGNADLHFQYLKLSARNTFNDMWQNVSTFFRNAVTVGQWWFENAFQMFVNLHKNAGGIFMNLTDQIKGMWQSVVNFFKTGKLEFDFQPLVKSFQLALDGIEMPRLETAQLNAYGQELENIQAEIAKRNQARWDANKQREAESHGEKIAQLKIEDDQAAKNHEKEKKRQFAFTSLAGLAESMQAKITGKGKAGGGAAAAVGANGGAAMAGGAIDQRALLGIMQRQAADIAVLSAQAAGGGLKIATGAGSVQIPSASINFGSGARA